LCENVPDGLIGDPEVARERVDFLSRQRALYVEMGRPGESIDYGTLSVSAQRSLVNSASGTPADREHLALLFFDLAGAYAAAGQPGGAETAFAEARDLAARLAADAPATARIHDLEANVCISWAEIVMSSRTRQAVAIELLERAVTIEERLVAGAPLARPGSE